MYLVANSQKFIAGLLFTLINILFCFKYACRISGIVGGITVLSYVVFLAILSILYKKGKIHFPFKVWIVLLSGFTLVSVSIFQWIPTESLHVDRWEMIQLFWDSALQGQYPYGTPSPTGNYPGPMPTYFLLAFPFYMLNEVGWMTLIAIWLSLYYWRKLEAKRLSLLMLLLLSSLSIYWEIFARSTIYINSLLFFLYFIELKKLPQCSNARFFGLAILGGILLSTRNVFVLPLIIWVGYVIRKQEIPLVKLFSWGGCFLLSFMVTFLPFYLMDPEIALQRNPFITQGSVLLPFQYVLLFVGWAVVNSFFCKRYTDVCMQSGVLLFLTITGHVIYALSESGIDAYLTAGADISYYIFCFPFLLESIVNTDVR